MSIYHLPLKRHIYDIQKHFNYVYRKDNSYYIHEPVTECLSESFKCKTRFTCSLCFKLTCEEHYSSHASICCGRENDKQCNNHHTESDSILKYGTCVAISILRNTTDMDTFRRLLFSHYLFRKAIIDDKICRTMFIGSMTKKSMRARIIKGLRRGDICNNSRCKQKKMYCLNCARLFCLKHIENHTVCGTNGAEKCNTTIDGTIRCAIYHSDVQGVFRIQDTKEKIGELMKNWDEETWIKALTQKYQLITNITQPKYSEQVFSCVWKQNKQIAYMLLEKTKRTSQMYIDMLNFVSNIRSPCVDAIIFDLGSLSREKITEEALKAWIETDKSRRCGIMLDFGFVNENHLILAVTKDYRNIEYIPKNLGTKNIYSIVEQSDKTSVYLPWFNFDLINEEYALNYVKRHGDYNNVIYSQICNKFPMSCQNALDKFKLDKKLRKQRRGGGLGGGLMSLVAYGAQDIYLTGNY